MWRQPGEFTLFRLFTLPTTARIAVLWALNLNLPRLDNAHQESRLPLPRRAGLTHYHRQKHKQQQDSVSCFANNIPTNNKTWMCCGCLCLRVGIWDLVDFKLCYLSSLHSRRANNNSRPLAHKSHARQRAPAGKRAHRAERPASASPATSRTPPAAKGAARTSAQDCARDERRALRGATCGGPEGSMQHRSFW